MRNQMVHVPHHQQIIHCLDHYLKLEGFLHWGHMGFVHHIFNLSSPLQIYVTYLIVCEFLLFSRFKLQQHQLQLLLLVGCPTHLQLITFQFPAELLVSAVHQCQVLFQPAILALSWLLISGVITCLDCVIDHLHFHAMQLL